jgi:mannose-6-phosphate isomerase-like protein (cupin superfamily)
MKFHLTIKDGIRQLEKETQNRFTVLLKTGSTSVEYYAPQKLDLQKPHSQDELYVIASGNSTFLREKESVECKAGDVLFVPAGMEHRFENFSNDFAVWVIFYGTEGGETK